MALTKITSKVLGDEFTTSSALSGTAIDWTASQVFTKTLSGPITFTYTNDEIGMVKDLVLTGDYGITWPTGTKIISGTYDGSVANLLQIVKTAAGQYWLSISKET